MVKLAMLNAMASADFAQSLDVQQSLGIDTLDLKDHIFGKSVADLSLAEAAAAAALIKPRGMSVYCLSTQLFHDDPGKGEAALIRGNLSRLDHLIEVARAQNDVYPHPACRLEAGDATRFAGRLRRPGASPVSVAVAVVSGGDRPDLRRRLPGRHRE